MNWFIRAGKGSALSAQASGLAPGPIICVVLGCFLNRLLFFEPGLLLFVMGQKRVGHPPIPTLLAANI